MVKVLHIAGSSMFGGGAIIICRLAEMSRKIGWQADVLTTNFLFKELLRERGVGVVDLDVVRREICPLQDLSGLLRLWWFLVRNHYDIVHTHTSKGGFIGRLAARAAGVKVVVHTAHGFAFHEESPRSILRFYTFLERIAALACDRIITVSEYHRRWGLELKLACPNKVVAIPNGIPPERVAAKRSRECVRLGLGIGENVCLLIAIGRLAEQKGLTDLVEALRLITDQSTTPFKLAFAGSGPLEPSLRRCAADLRIEDRVLFLGFRKDIGDLLQASDLVVLPSLWEGLSISLLEAMAAGKPIITTTIKSNLEATRSGEAALLVPAKDPQAIAEAAIKLSADDKLRESLAEKAREIFFESYTEKEMLESYHKQYLELSGKKPPLIVTRRESNREEPQLERHGGLS